MRGSPPGHGVALSPNSPKKNLSVCTIKPEFISQRLLQLSNGAEAIDNLYQPLSWARERSHAVGSAQAEGRDSHRPRPASPCCFGPSLLHARCCARRTGAAHRGAAASKHRKGQRRGRRGGFWAVFLLVSSFSPCPTAAARSPRRGSVRPTWPTYSLSCATGSVSPLTLSLTSPERSLAPTPSISPLSGQHAVRQVHIGCVPHSPLRWPRAFWVWGSLQN